MYIFHKRNYAYNNIAMTTLTSILSFPLNIGVCPNLFFNKSKPDEPSNTRAPKTFGTAHEIPWEAPWHLKWKEKIQIPKRESSQSDAKTY